MSRRGNSFVIESFQDSIFLRNAATYEPSIRSRIRLRKWRALSRRVSQEPQRLQTSSRRVTQRRGLPNLQGTTISPGTKQCELGTGLVLFAVSLHSLSKLATANEERQRINDQVEFSKSCPKARTPQFGDNRFVSVRKCPNQYVPQESTYPGRRSLRELVLG